MASTIACAASSPFTCVTGALISDMSLTPFRLSPKGHQPARLELSRLEGAEFREVAVVQAVFTSHGSYSSGLIVHCNPICKITFSGFFLCCWLLAEVGIASLWAREQMHGTLLDKPLFAEVFRGKLAGFAVASHLRKTALEHGGGFACGVKPRDFVVHDC